MDSAPRVLTPVKRRPVRLIAFGAGAGALAAGVAVALTVTSPSTPDRAPSPGSLAAPTTQATVIDSQLVSLAFKIQGSNERPPGDASLIKRTQKIGGRATTVSYDLFTDAGAYYAREDKASLSEAIERDEDLSDGLFARTVAAARFAADADPEAARLKMANATPNDLGLGLSESKRQEIWDDATTWAPGQYRPEGFEWPENPPSGKELDLLVDNMVWINSIDALSAGAGDTEVRAGVLRLMSTIDGVSFKESTTAGTLTLTFTEGKSASGTTTVQQLVIDARTGMPVASTTKTTGQDAESSRSTFAVTRVKISDLLSQGA